MLRTLRCAAGTPVVLAALLLSGCTAPTPEPSVEPGPCDSFWGPTPASGRVFVDAAAASAGDGSATAPFTTLGDALTQVRATGERSIVLTPGEYPGRYALSQNQLEWLDSDLEIAGCGREATTLAAIEAEEPDLNDMVWRIQPVFAITGDQTSGIYVHDLAVVGGRRAIIVRLGAGKNGPIVFERVDVLDSVRMGVLLDGEATVAHLLDVQVDGVEADEGLFGWGIGVQTGAWAGAVLADPTVLQDVVVSDVQAFGVLADGGWVQLTDSEVSDVATVDGTMGRGVQFQQWTTGTLDGLSVSGASDAAVVLESPGRSGAPVEVFDCDLGPTLEATVPGAPEMAADGLVATQAAAEPSAASDFLVVVDGTALSGNPRVHMLADAVTMSVGPNNIFGKGSGYPLVSQGSAIVQGIGGGAPGEPAAELDASDALDVNRALAELDQLGVN